jgi:hypothetical protein
MQRTIRRNGNELCAFRCNGSRPLTACTTRTMECLQLHAAKSRICENRAKKHVRLCLRDDLTFKMTSDVNFVHCKVEGRNETLR